MREAGVSVRTKVRIQSPDGDNFFIDTVMRHGRHIAIGQFKAVAGNLSGASQLEWYVHCMLDYFVFDVTVFEGGASVFMGYAKKPSPAKREFLAKRGIICWWPCEYCTYIRARQVRAIEAAGAPPKLPSSP